MIEDPAHRYMPQFPIQVFFDGSCAVCATEIEHYLQREPTGKIIAVDIAAADFNPAPYTISRDAFMRELHVIDSVGNVYRGVEAFMAIWQAFPDLSIYRCLGTFLGLPLVNPVARLLYKGFATVRPYLPKRKSSCSSGICRMNR
jgi:predicted DCC family thiol-disulfide oxidoreductase YuxK